MRSRRASRLCSASTSWKTSASRRYDSTSAASWDGVSGSGMSRRGNAWSLIGAVEFRRTAAGETPPFRTETQQSEPPDDPNPPVEGFRGGGYERGDCSRVPAGAFEPAGAAGGGRRLPRLPPLAGRYADGLRRG